MSPSQKSSIRVRFAPSPTGHLHIGGLRAAIFNWLFARHHGGTFLLRIEDTDVERSKEEYTDSILSSLSWAGIDFDEPLVIQSHRLAVHQKLIAQLLAEGKAYYCFCSQEEVEQRWAAAGNDPAFVKYDGKCRLDQSRVGSGDPAAVRFSIPHDVREIRFDDLIRGTITVDSDQLDDFIIARSDGHPMYNFVVVVDDADARISHIIRGEDHISNTPKQILLYRAFGYSIPFFAHLPMVLGQSGQRLSKRDAATSVLDYKHNGYLPEALCNYLVRLGWAHGDQEIFTREELINLFSLEAVNKKSAVFDPEKLNWVNSTYIKQTTPERLFQIMVRDIDPLLAGRLKGWTDTHVYAALDLYKDRVATLAEMVEKVCVLHDGPTDFNQQDMQQWVTSAAGDHLKEVIETFESLPSFEADLVQATLKELSKKLGIKLVAIAQPLRIALIGNSDGPGVFGLLSVVGKTETVRRITRLLSQITIQ
jgi:glutamyl-tRNA synthetase